jgi:ATP-dependent Clp protease ATP-binding subunit ClpA
VSLETVRRAVTAALPARSDDVPALIPFDARSKKALELTYRAALAMGHDYIGTEHILLALLEVDGDSDPLTGLGISRSTAETSIAAAVAARAAGRPT